MMHLYNMVDEYDKEEDKIGMKIQRVCLIIIVD